MQILWKGRDTLENANRTRKLTLVQCFSPRDGKDYGVFVEMKYVNDAPQYDNEFWYRLREIEENQGMRLYPQNVWGIAAV